MKNSTACRYLLSGIIAIAVLFSIFQNNNSGNAPVASSAEKEAETDGIAMAISQEFNLTRDPALNEIPRDRLIHAAAVRDQKLAMMDNQRAVGGIGWQERGPVNVGGRTRAILYDLSDAANGYKKVWTGGVGGGLWYTNDITALTPSWHVVDDFLGNIAITTLAQDPSNPLIMYAGTGEGWFNIDAIRGLGIWKSTDGGLTWAQLASTNNSTFHYIQKIVVTSGGVVLAATRSGGVQRSINGGTSWTPVLSAGVNGGATPRAADLEIAAGGNIYASMGIFTVDGIFRSTDNGLSWTKIYTSAADENRIELACAPSNLDVVYALVHNGTTDAIKKVMRTLNATNVSPTWTTLTTPPWCDQGSASTDFTRNQAWYDLIALVDPVDQNTVYIGGIDVLKTTDGGTSWTQITQWASGCTGASVHADIHCIINKPGSASEIMVGCDGGIYRTTNSGASFNSRNPGYNVTQYYACAVHPTSGTNYFLAGAQDNGSQRFTSAGLNTTTTATGGDGGFCHIDQDNPLIQITSYIFNNYFVSTDGGTTFISQSKNNNGQFINPTDYDNTANILYGGNSGGSFFRWLSPSTNGATTNVSVAEFAGASVTHVTVSPITANRVYFGLSNGSVVMVDNANTGSPLTGVITKVASGPVSVSSIAIDPSNENHQLVTISNFGTTQVFESFNATAAPGIWTSVQGDLPDMPVRWAMFDPRNNDWAILATELGVWSTDNLNGGGTTNWNPTNAGLANVRVDMLQYRSSDRTIVAATHGRGLFSAVVPTAATPDIRFVTATSSRSEQFAQKTTCRSYKDYVVNMTIDNPPTGAATITVNLQAGPSATQGVDFDYNTNNNFGAPSNTFTFNNGATDAKPVYIRIYDDAEVEANESFTLTYSISGGTNAQAGSTNQTHTFTIVSNDAAPGVGSSNTYTIGTVNAASSATSPFRSSNQRARSQFIFLASELSAAGLVAGPLNALTLNVTTKVSTIPFTGFTVSLAQTTLATDLGGGFIGGFTQVYTGNYSTVAGLNTFNFSSPFIWDGTSNLVVQTCFDNAAAGPGNDQVDANNSALGGAFATTYVATNAAGTGCSLNAVNISAFRPTMRFLQTIPQASVESVLTNSSRSEYLAGNSDAYFYSAADGELMARVRNLSSHNYGCTSVEIDRAGTSSSQFWNTNTANYLMNKTFRVIPTTNNPLGSYEVTLYFTQAEVNGWQTATGQTWANIQLIKIPSQISNVTPATPEPDGVGTVQVVTPTLGTLGTHFTITYTFSNGFSGFGAGVPGSAAPLPVQLLGFSGRLLRENSLLEWSTAFEQNSRGFEVEKSYDGINFRKIGFVASAGNSNITRRYSFTDPERAVEHNYYRLKLVDIDNTFDYSDVVLIKNVNSKQDVVVMQNPFNSDINIRFAKIPNDRLTLCLYDMKGSKIYEAGYGHYTQPTLKIPTSSRSMAAGVYSLRVETGGKTYNLKLIKN